MKTLNLIVLTMILTGLLVNCGSKDTDSIKGLEKEIAEKENKIDTIKKEIKAIKKKINKNTPEDKKKDTRILINIKKIKYEIFTHYINQNGSIEAVNSAFVSPELNGQIKKIFVKEGDYVKKGKLLVKLNSSIIEGNIKEIKTALKLAKTIYEKRKGLWKKKIGSEIQYLDAKTSMDSLKNKLETLYSQFEMTKIKAPINGIIETVFPKVGELAIPGAQLIQLVNLDKLYIITDVSERYLPSIKKGDWAKLTFSSYPDLTKVEKVYLTGNSINVKNRTFKVKLLIDNVDGKLKPNNLVLVKLKDFIAKEAIIIPSIIIKRDINGDYVYIVENSNNKMTAKKVYIKIGLSEGGYSMVLKGISIGNSVVTKGYNMVKNGIEVRIQTKADQVENKSEQKINN